MPDLYSVFVFILFALAITDLVVGVSNDAVNFLISAIGAKVAPRKVIMAIAGLGVFVGATFSSGMMEVARKGIFHPEHFYFSEIMIIFLAVMITDIILLDTFNSLGLPTSTTVSIVFELLGAAVAISLIKITQADEGVQHLATYINSEKALEIITGILLSVVVAFSVGMLVQYFSRILFTFNFKKKLKWVGVLWGALAMAVLTHFLFVKGLKGASFIDPATAEWLKKGSISLGSISLPAIFLIDLISFGAWFIIMKVVERVSEFNILKIVVLGGTFALAMAFAGNDLVNFIGVPIAGLESYLSFSAQGIAPDAMTMEVLTEPVQTKTYLLLVAGAVMVVTLWTSRKARTVTETSVNLSRQAEGQEKFRPNQVSRGLVRGVQTVSETIGKTMSVSFRDRLARRFAPAKMTDEERKDPPAFDVIRASVNLTVASMLISIATSLKLPLSTTYVTFMVAMGTSLADKAWGRESAVYRVSGVIQVIGGWFFTAFIAFTVAAIFASIMYAFGPAAVFVLLGVAIFLIVRSFVRHRRKEKEGEAQRSFEADQTRLNASSIKQGTLRKAITSLHQVRLAYKNAVEGLMEEDKEKLKMARREAAELEKQNEQFRYNLYGYIKRINEEDAAAHSKKYLSIYDFEHDLINCVSRIVESCNNHIANSHKPMDEAQKQLLEMVLQEIENFFDHLVGKLTEQDFSELPWILDWKSRIFLLLEETTHRQVSGIQDESYSSRNSLLLFSLVFETRSMIAVATRFLKFYAHESDLELAEESDAPQAAEQLN